MRVGLATPVVTMLPGAHAGWEVTGTIADLGRIAESADRLGFHHLSCSEHVGVPASQADGRGTRYWDPLATFGYLAARTEHIRLVTYVLVLGYHHPLEVVKRYGTLDHVSGGRVVLGVGVGTLEEEFELLGAPFDDRGVRADDAIRALRAALPSNEPSYEGTHYAFDGLVVDPCALQEHVPIWVGGQTFRSYRRAVELADGWCPFNVSRRTAAEWMARLEPPPGFEVVLQPRPFDPSGDPDATAAALAKLDAAGATVVHTGLIHHSLEHYLEQLEALAAVDGFTSAPR